jgi:hypothetical protein
MALHATPAMLTVLTRMPASNPLPSVTTVSYRVAQFIARHKSFVPDFNVPIADGHG